MSKYITVAGLGSGDEAQLTVGVWQLLQSAERVFIRTAKHPSAQLAISLNEHTVSFDELYEQRDSFAEVYEELAERLLAEAEAAKNGIVYAVPGHPMVAEYTVQLLRERCPERGIALRIVGGESFLDQAFLRFGFDPIEGFQLLDGTDIAASRLDVRRHTLIAQVYDRMVASDVKLALMETYPDDHIVVIGHALGVVEQERIVTAPLHDLDRLDGYGNLSLIWVPRSAEESLRNRSFDRLHEIVSLLRSPEGCPWDREQTHESIRKYLIEETCEVLDTIDEDDPQSMCEELGDLLLQIMLHSQMEEETGTFTVWDVIEEINTKLVRRHPHVFGDQAARDAEEALQQWQLIKQQEKAAKGGEESSVFGNLPRALPGLMTAWRVQKKASSVGFDWKHRDEAAAKVSEELRELLEAAQSGEAERIREELGDLLFSVVNVARFVEVEPEEAIAAANAKFVRRFSYVEQQLRLSGKTFEQTDLLEMDRLWEEAKKVEAASQY